MSCRFGFWGVLFCLKSRGPCRAPSWGLFDPFFSPNKIMKKNRQIKKISTPRPEPFFFPPILFTLLLPRWQLLLFTFLSEGVATLAAISKIKQPHTNLQGTAYVRVCLNWILTVYSLMQRLQLFSTLPAPLYSTSSTFFIFYYFFIQLNIINDKYHLTLVVVLVIRGTHACLVLLVVVVIVR